MSDGFYKYTYHKRMNLSNILLLEGKGDCGNVIETFKILNGFTDVDHKKMLQTERQYY